MENEMFKVATYGDVDSLRVIIKNDELILGKFVSGCFNWSPLHVAASQGHGKFVDELLSLNLDLARASDSQNWSALHVAAAKGHIEVVKVLLIKLGPNICYSRDRDGRAPLHVATTKGEVQVVKELLRANPDVSRARLDHDETILHLCVKHHQFTVLTILLETIKDKDFVNAKDDRRNTLLHMAVYKKQVEVIKYVLYCSQIEVNAKNLNGQTAFDILYVLTATSDDAEKRELDSIKGLLLEAYGKGGTQIGTFDWFERKDILMLVASIITTTSYQTAVNPPGGFWQDNMDGHRAGEAVLATNNPKLYSSIMWSNTLTFIISMSILFVTAFQIPKGILGTFLVICSYMLILEMASTYGNTLSALEPAKNTSFQEIYKKIVSELIPPNYIMVGAVMIAWIAGTFALTISFYRWFFNQQKVARRDQNVLSIVRDAGKSRECSTSV